MSVCTICSSTYRSSTAPLVSVYQCILYCAIVLCPLAELVIGFEQTEYTTEEGAILEIVVVVNFAPDEDLLVAIDVSEDSTADCRSCTTCAASVTASFDVLLSPLILFVLLLCCHVAVV